MLQHEIIFRTLLGGLGGFALGTPWNQAPWYELCADDWPGSPQEIHLREGGRWTDQQEDLQCNPAGNPRPSREALGRWCLLIHGWDSWEG